MKRGKKVRRYKDRLREILDVAAKLFSKKGFEATSIQDISDKLGLEKGAIYYWVKSKDEILYHLIDKESKLFLRTVNSLMRKDIQPDEKLKLFIGNHINVLTSNLDRAAVFFNEYRALPKKWKKKILKLRKNYEAILRNVIEEGQKSGAIRKDISPKIIALAIFGMVNWVFHWFSPQKEFSPQEIARMFSQMIMEGLRPNKSS